MEMQRGQRKDDPIDLLQKVLDKQLAFVSAAWGQASAYDTAITVAGYGAFFALWSGTSADVTQAARVLSAALMGISLALYIAWNLVVMLGRHKFDLEYVAILSGPNRDPQHIIAEWEKVDAKLVRQQMSLVYRLWPIIFRGSVLFGFAGAATLIYNYIALLTGLPELIGFRGA